MLRFILPGMLACLMTSIAISKGSAKIVSDFQKNPLVCSFPFQLIGNTIVIQANVDNRMGSFILDSGSPSLILNTRYFKNISLDNTRYRSVDLIGLTTNNLKKTSVHLQVDNIEKRNQKAFLINLSNIEKSKKIEILGVIGYSFLKHFEIVFDYQQKEITLFALDRRGERETKASLHLLPAQVIRLKKSSHLLYLEAKINNQTLKLGLDCGAEISVLDKNVVRKFKENFISSHRASLVAFNGKKASVNVGRMKRVFIENIELDLFEVVVMDLSPINRNLIIKLDGLLGNGFLLRQKIAINYKKQTLYLWDSPMLVQW